MAVNIDAIKLAANVGSTPGFRLDKQDDGRYKLTRLAIPAVGLETASLVMSPRAGDQSYKNTVARVKKVLGWTPALFEQCEQIAHRHRVEQTDPAEEQLAALLAALEVDPSPPPAPDAPAVPGPRRRHSGGGTATGSAKKPSTVAAPAGPADVEPGSVPILVKTDVYHQLELITPERAMHLLLNIAPYQRDTRNPKVAGHAGAMVRGEWLANPADSVCVDTNGQTCNGAHRLTAVLESMTAQEMFVAYNVPPETYAVMDRVLRRSTADMLHGAGESNTAHLAALCKLAFLWFNVPEQGQWKQAADSVTEAQVYATLENHPGLRESARLGKIGKGMSVSPAGAQLAHYLISRQMGGDTGLVTRWYQAIANVELSLHQPGHSLGLYFLKSKPGANRRKTLVGRTRREVDMYLIIQAWNNTCVGREMRTAGAPHADFKIAQPIVPIPGRHRFPPLD